MFGRKPCQRIEHFSPCLLGNVLAVFCGLSYFHGYLSSEQTENIGTVAHSETNAEHTAYVLLGVQ